MHNRAWIRDIDLQHAGFTSQHFVEYVQLWHVLNHLQLQSDREDNIIWNFVPDGKFTTGSAYHAQFIGSTMTNFKRLIWKVWHHQNASSLGGSPSKIESRPPIDYKREHDQIMVCALFADTVKNLESISFKTVVTLGAFGRELQCG